MVAYVRHCNVGFNEELSQVVSDVKQSHVVSDEEQCHVGSDVKQSHVA